MRSSEWRTLRAVVEIKVRGHDAPTEHDVQWALKQVIEGRWTTGVSLEGYLRKHHPGTQQGRLYVKQGTRVIAAAVSKAFRNFWMGRG